MSRDAKLRELEQLQAAVKRLETELDQEGALPSSTKGAEDHWPPRSYYTAYHALTGGLLGIFGAAASLLFNVVGALVVGEPPLKLIQTYLTFGMGKKALEITPEQGGLALAIGCCLYLATGMVYGVIFQVILTRFFPTASFATRFLVVSVLSLLVWLVNFYGILIWLQPMLFQGNWIVETVPWWVAALTHLVFGWTMLLVQPLGAFRPYGLKTEGQ